uniref:C2H2-type domain-containing protein n=1 Tax=Compsopogon caeruleus TaxID=31354 RepID=A0A7S1XFL3_9RHOD
MDRFRGYPIEVERWMTEPRRISLGECSPAALEWALSISIHVGGIPCRLMFVPMRVELERYVLGELFNPDYYLWLPEKKENEKHGGGSEDDGSGDLETSGEWTTASDAFLERCVGAHFLLDLDNPDKIHCSTEMRSGTRIIGTYHFSHSGMIDATKDVLRENGHTSEIFYEIRRVCPFCQIRGVVCACPESFRCRIWPPPNSRASSWHEFVTVYGRPSVESVEPVNVVFETTEKEKELQTVVCCTILFGNQIPVDERVPHWFLRNIGLNTGPSLEPKLGPSHTNVFKGRRISRRNLPSTSKPDDSSFKTVSPVERQDHVLVEGAHAMDLSATPTVTPKKPGRRIRPKKIPCPDCDKRFSQKGHLASHIAIIHRRERPFRCEVCPSSFGTSSNLRRHCRMVHEKSRGFECLHCELSFCEPGDLRAHMKRKHLVSQPLDDALGPLYSTTFERQL